MVALDGCLAAGFRQPKLLRTRPQPDFASLLAEVVVADAFRLPGFGIAGFDASKRTDPVPDIAVEGPSVSAAIEVYAPADYENLERS